MSEPVLRIVAPLPGDGGPLVDRRRSEHLRRHPGNHVVDAGAPAGEQIAGLRPGTRGELVEVADRVLVCQLLDRHRSKVGAETLLPAAEGVRDLARERLGGVETGGVVERAQADKGRACGVRRRLGILRPWAQHE